MWGVRGGETWCRVAPTLTTGLLTLSFAPQNLNQNPRTLLPKFYGLYCVQSGGKNIRVVVMNNILPRVVKMHLKFDLKGSTYKRRASKKEKEKSIPTYKDLDFIQDMPEGLMLDADTFTALVKTLQRDCLVRRSLRSQGTPAHPAALPFSLLPHSGCYDRYLGVVGIRQFRHRAHGG